MINRYIPPSTTFKIIADFNKSKLFQFIHENQSCVECSDTDAVIVVAAMLEDHEGSGGMQRLIKLFI